MQTIYTRTRSLLAKRAGDLMRLAATLALILGITPALAQQAYYIHPDHLNTPRLIENQSQQVVWRWDNEDPFGANMANANPSGLGAFTFNPRLPGQYFDAETNYHYNYFRDYSPETGRYVQSDPIGLMGGMNTYGYVDASPIDDVDPVGLTRRGAPNTPNVTQGIRNATANTLLSQIQQYQPNYSYPYVTTPGQGGYTQQMLGQLQQTLLQFRKANQCTPNFVVSSSGTVFPVPQGSGLMPNINPGGRITGQAFSGGTGGGPSLSPAVTQLRLMDPTNIYPSGYANYMNAGGQSVNPMTGRTIQPSDPWWHIPF